MLLRVRVGLARVECLGLATLLVIPTLTRQIMHALDHFLPGHVLGLHGKLFLFLHIIN